MVVVVVVLANVEVSSGMAALRSSCLTIFISFWSGSSDLDGLRSIALLS